MNILSVILGGAIGALLRVYGSEYINKCMGGTFPYGTMVVNILGTFCIGLFVAFLNARPDLSSWIRMLLISGCLGAFTTFSTFMYDILQFSLEGQYAYAAYYAGIQLVVGFLLCGAGFYIGKLI